MKDIIPNANGFPNIELEERFLHTKHFFYLDYDPIFPDDKIVKPLENYDLFDFPDDGSIVVKHVRFCNAVLKNDVMKIICIQPSTKRILHRCHPANDDCKPCDWLLLPKDYFKDDLLEFEF